MPACTVVLVLEAQQRVREGSRLSVYGIRRKKEAAVRNVRRDGGERSKAGFAAARCDTAGAKDLLRDLSAPHAAKLHAQPFDKTCELDETGHLGEFWSGASRRSIAAV